MAWPVLDESLSALEVGGLGLALAGVVIVRLRASRDVERVMPASCHPLAGAALGVYVGDDLAATLEDRVTAARLPSAGPGGRTATRACPVKQDEPGR